LQDESIHPDDRDSVRAGIARAARSQDICELQYRVQLGERVRLVNLRAMPLVKPDGAITEWLAVATDITDSPA
jgi:PAS domain-containing protein